MYIVIARGGMIGKGLAARLTEARHDVVVIDVDPAVCEEIYAEHGALTINGSATELRTLEQARIEMRLAQIGVPAPTRLQKRHGDVVIGDILRQGRVGARELDCAERLVLFHRVSDKGVGALMHVIKSLDVPRPIFAVVTDTSITWTLSQLMAHLIEEKKAHEGST